MEVEIQVTTQLQDVSRNLTHDFYEKSRLFARGGFFQMEMGVHL